TWTIRNTYSYRRLLNNSKAAQQLPRSRFKLRPSSLPEPDYGDILSPLTALSSSGPLNALGAGDLSKWLAVPWQTDTASCRAGYEQFTPSTPTFWPARVPNHVLTEEDYQTVMTSKDPVERWAAFHRRVNWLRNLGGGFESILRMVTEFGNLGVVERRPGPGDGEFPDTIFVESLPSTATAPRPATAAPIAVMAAHAAVPAAPEAIPIVATASSFVAPEANAAADEEFMPKIARLQINNQFKVDHRTS
ncbi:MAG: LodA/GoxA family CTQ-dependent oxidase, partial [Planctomycetota bacterium]